MTIDVTTFGQGMFDFAGDMTAEEIEAAVDYLIAVLDEIAAQLADEDPC